MIAIRSPGMKNVVVGEELYVADGKDHMKWKNHARLLEDVGGDDLGGGEWEEEAGGGEAGWGGDVVRIPSYLPTHMGWGRMLVFDVS